MIELSVENLHLTYGDNPVLKGVSMELKRGEVVSLLGPSGSGKTTLLRAVAGLEKPTSGIITIGKTRVYDGNPRSEIPAEARNLGLVFQSYALWPHKTVFENVAYPLREHTRLPAPLLKSTVMMKLEAVGLRGAAKLMPSELSGGMARRAALARAIALEPDLIMFDEPFVGQDPITMGVLVKLISELNSSLGVTCIVVSHDVPEVLSIADYAYIVADKRIIAHGEAQALQTNTDARVRQFLDGNADGPVPFRYPAGDYQHDLLSGTGS